MQKAHPILLLAQRSALRQASRAGRFAKLWHLSRRPPSRPQPLNATAASRLRAVIGKKTS